MEAELIPVCNLTLYAEKCASSHQLNVVDSTMSVNLITWCQRLTLCEVTCHVVMAARNYIVRLQLCISVPVSHARWICDSWCRLDITHLRQWSSNAVCRLSCTILSPVCCGLCRLTADSSGRGCELVIRCLPSIYLSWWPGDAVG